MHTGTCAACPADRPPPPTHTATHNPHRWSLALRGASGHPPACPRPRGGCRGAASRSSGAWHWAWRWAPAGGGATHDTRRTQAWGRGHGRGVCTCGRAGREEKRPRPRPGEGAEIPPPPPSPHRRACSPPEPHLCADGALQRAAEDDAQLAAPQLRVHATANLRRRERAGRVRDRGQGQIRGRQIRARGRRPGWGQQQSPLVVCRQEQGGGRWLLLPGRRAAGHAATATRQCSSQQAAATPHLTRDGGLVLLAGLQPLLAVVGAARGAAAWGKKGAGSGQGREAAWRHAASTEYEHVLHAWRAASALAAVHHKNELQGDD